MPTIGFNMEVVEYKNLKFQVWDLGGQNSIRYIYFNIGSIGKCIFQILMQLFMWLIAAISKDSIKPQNSSIKFYK